MSQYTIYLVLTFYMQNTARFFPLQFLRKHAEKKLVVDIWGFVEPEFSGVLDQLDVDFLKYKNPPPFGSRRHTGSTFLL